MKTQAWRLCAASVLGTGLSMLTGCGGGGETSDATAAESTAKAVSEQAQAATANYAKVHTITGKQLPGLVSMVYAAPETLGSGGMAKIQSPTVVTPGIKVNAFSGTAAHRAGFSIQNAQDPVGWSSLSAPLVQPSARKSSRPFASVPVNRHYSADPVFDAAGYLTSSRWIVSHDLSPINARYSSFTLWSYHGAYRSGYFTGRPVVWGSFAWGSTTRADDMPTSGSKQYAGLAGMHWLIPNWNYFSVPYGTAKAVFDAAKMTVTVTVLPKEFGSLSMRLHPLQEENGPMWDDATSWLTAAVKCKAKVDRSTGAFSCNDPTQNAEISGRFYGPGAGEIAGTFRRSLSGYYPLIGGFTAKLK